MHILSLDSLETTWTRRGQRGRVWRNSRSQRGFDVDAQHTWYILGCKSLVDSGERASDLKSIPSRSGQRYGQRGQEIDKPMPTSALEMDNDVDAIWTRLIDILRFTPLWRGCWIWTLRPSPSRGEGFIGNPPSPKRGDLFFPPEKEMRKWLRPQSALSLS